MYVDSSNCHIRISLQLSMVRGPRVHILLYYFSDLFRLQGLKTDNSLILSNLNRHSKILRVISIFNRWVAILHGQTFDAWFCIYTCRTGEKEFVDRIKSRFPRDVKSLISLRFEWHIWGVWGERTSNPEFFKDETLIRDDVKCVSDGIKFFDNMNASKIGLVRSSIDHESCCSE